MRDDSGRATMYVGVMWGIYASTDAGANWIHLNQSPISTRSLLILRDRVGNKVLLAGRDDGVFRSTDGGVTWALVNTGLPQSPYVNFMTAIDTVVFVGMHISADRALYRTFDYGDHWSSASQGMPQICWGVTSLAVIDSTVFAGMGCEPSVGKRPLVEVITGVEKTRPGIPTHVSLAQNYPNPFNPSTKIEFEIQERGEVDLRVYDVLGREVRRLVQEQREPGHHQVDVDGNRLSSGVYYYRLTIRSRDREVVSQTRKMILVR